MEVNVTHPILFNAFKLIYWKKNANTMKIFILLVMRLVDKQKRIKLSIFAYSYLVTRIYDKIIK